MDFKIFKKLFKKKEITPFKKAETICREIHQICGSLQINSTIEIKHPTTWCTQDGSTIHIGGSPYAYLGNQTPFVHNMKREDTFVVFDPTVATIHLTVYDKHFTYDVSQGTKEHEVISLAANNINKIYLTRELTKKFASCLDVLQEDYPEVLADLVLRGVDPKSI